MHEAEPASWFVPCLEIHLGSPAPPASLSCHRLQGPLGGSHGPLGSFCSTACHPEVLNRPTKSLSWRPSVAEEPHQPSTHIHWTDRMPEHMVFFLRILSNFISIVKYTVTRQYSVFVYFLCVNRAGSLRCVLAQNLAVAGKWPMQQPAKPAGGADWRVLSHPWPVRILVNGGS